MPYSMMPMTYMLPPIAGAYSRPLVSPPSGLSDFSGSQWDQNAPPLEKPLSLQEKLIQEARAKAEQQARYDAGMKRIGGVADQITNDLNAGYAADMARRPQQVQDMADAMVAREYPMTGPRLRKDLVPNPMANRFPASGQVPMQLQLPPIQSLPSPEDAGRDPMAANTDAIYGGWGSTAGYAPGVNNWRNSRAGQAKHLANITMGQNHIRQVVSEGDSLRQFKEAGDGPQIPILPGAYQLRGGIVNPTLRKENSDAKLAAINAARVARMADGRAAYQAAQQSRAAAEEAKFAARNPGYRQAVEMMMPGVALAREKMANDLALAKAANETALGVADRSASATKYGHDIGFRGVQLADDTTRRGQDQSSRTEANKSIVDQITSLVAMYQTPNLTPLERHQIQSQIDALRGQLGGSTPVSTQPRPVPVAPNIPTATPEEVGAFNAKSALSRDRIGRAIQGGQSPEEFIYDPSNKGLTPKHVLDAMMPWAKVKDVKTAPMFDKDTIEYQNFLRRMYGYDPVPFDEDAYNKYITDSVDSYPLGYGGF